MSHDLKATTPDFPMANLTFTMIAGTHGGGKSTYLKTLQDVVFPKLNRTYDEVYLINPTAFGDPLYKDWPRNMLFDDWQDVFSRIEKSAKKERECSDALENYFKAVKKESTLTTSIAEFDELHVRGCEKTQELPSLDGSAKLNFEIIDPFIKDGIQPEKKRLVLLDDCAGCPWLSHGKGETGLGRFAKLCRHFNTDVILSVQRPTDASKDCRSEVTDLILSAGISEEDNEVVYKDILSTMFPNKKEYKEFYNVMMHRDRYHQYPYLQFSKHDQNNEQQIIVGMRTKFAKNEQGLFEITDTDIFDENTLNPEHCANLKIAKENKKLLDQKINLLKEKYFIEANGWTMRQCDQKIKQLENQPRAFTPESEDFLLSR